jgi:hypothetical protein
MPKHTRKRTRLQPFPCPTCGTVFKPRNYKSKYCSVSCQNRGRRHERVTPEVKACSKCGKLKPATAFHKSEQSPDNLQSQCRECQASRLSTVINYDCKQCGIACSRTLHNPSRKVRQQRICSKCKLRQTLLENSNGHSHNYTGLGFVSGRAISGWKRSAERRGWSWKITHKDLRRQYREQGGLCALSGIEMVVDVVGSPYRPSLDRIDPNRGYFADNIQFVCSVVNIMRNKLTERRFIRICKKIVKHRG